VHLRSTIRTVVLLAHISDLHIRRFFYDFVHLLVLHSFPTRRSSDLDFEFIDLSAHPHHAHPLADRAQLLREQDFNRQVFEKAIRSEEHTSELQSRENLVCRLLLEKKKSNCLATTLVTLPYISKPILL